ncbi:hypothetical protein [Pseudomonas sp.]|uniref:hypothetical protein n=1 Tax=Pseudomonas sp. TaxID=306 RepID=UPI0028B18A42|nr:hypothetical protein [Pseudomonas sp.]
MANRKFLIIGAIVTFVLALSLALILLIYSRVSGAEFAAFVISFAVLAVAISCAPEIQEVSIAGNVVKLREVKAEAVAAIQSLNESRVEMLSVFLSLALKHGGGFSSGSVIDPRNYQFWYLIGLIKKYQCVDSLRVQIGGNLHVLMFAQIRQLQERNDDVSSLDKLPMPTVFELTEAVLSPDGIAKAQERKKGADLKREILEGLEEYLRLDQLRAELGVCRDDMNPSG